MSRASSVEKLRKMDTEGSKTDTEGSKMSYFRKRGNTIDWKRSG
jgi:hypothetical protein